MENKVKNFKQFVNENHSFNESISKKDIDVYRMSLYPDKGKKRGSDEMIDKIGEKLKKINASKISYTKREDDGVSCSIEDIKKWVDKEIGYYDECKNISDAIDDMLHDFKTHFLKIGLDETFENEKELIKYFKSEWKNITTKQSF